MVARLSHIQVFPVKSLDPRSINQVNVLSSGALQHDRRFALVDAEGQFINGKRTPLIHRIRSKFDVASNTLHLEIDAHRRSFSMNSDRLALESWLAEHFSMPVKVQENTQCGFPDDLDATGPTVISTATLETVASWFPGLTLEEGRLRFRANLEINGVEPFWEDQLFGEMDQVVQFRVGNVLFEGMNPCQRCVVPTRSPLTGEPLKGFTKTFVERRRETLPAWAVASRFDHFYRLAVNTRLAPGESGGTIRTSDVVEIVGR